MPFIEANELTHQLVESMGPVDSKKLFMCGTDWKAGKTDDTHLNVYGAHRIAWTLLSEIKRAVPRLGRFVEYKEYPVK